MLALPVDRLRGAGLSGSKTASIRDLAEKVVDGSVQLDRIARLPDDEIERELTLVRGIGPWTAEMFLIFQLGRLDVWPVEDFGVRNGYARLYGLADVPPPRELVQFGGRYSTVVLDQAELRASIKSLQQTIQANTAQIAQNKASTTLSADEIKAANTRK